MSVSNGVAPSRSTRTGQSIKGGQEVANGYFQARGRPRRRRRSFGSPSARGELSTSSGSRRRGSGRAGRRRARRGARVADTRPP